MQTGVFAQVDALFMDIVGEDNSLMKVIGFPQVFGFAVVVGILNTIVGTALGAIASLVYNLLVRVLGGFQLGFTSN
jgi:ABC-type antimicrobial peptide transport system permease subunit